MHWSFAEKTGLSLDTFGSAESAGAFCIKLPAENKDVCGVSTVDQCSLLAICFKSSSFLQVNQDNTQLWSITSINWPKIPNTCFGIHALIIMFVPCTPSDYHFFINSLIVINISPIWKAIKTWHVSYKKQPLKLEYIDKLQIRPFFFSSLNSLFKLSSL